MAVRESDRKEQDEYGLYMSAMPDWPLSAEAFQDVAVKWNLQMYLDGEKVGFVWIDRDGQEGFIQLIVVRPGYRERGFGRHLLLKAEEWLASQHVRRIRLGAGSGYLWQGVPEDRHAWFLHRGYSIEETSVDMTVDLRSFEYPAHVDQRLPADMVFRPSCAADRDGLLAALADEDLVEWKPYYLSLMDA
ncbi:MAG: GNAT family N-acetyltransferase, partial [Clostridia bacterium]|nr:GNAT family N-acetyltransferase [Clostridia bacterium]